MKTQKGITLIALVITIIVMLILVGVTVTSALNGGLFNTAKNAAKRTQQEAVKEELQTIIPFYYLEKGKYDSENEDNDFKIFLNGKVTEGDINAFTVKYKVEGYTSSSIGYSINYKNFGFFINKNNLEITSLDNEVKIFSLVQNASDLEVGNEYIIASAPYDNDIVYVLDEQLNYTDANNGNLVINRQNKVFEMLGDSIVYDGEYALKLEGTADNWYLYDSKNRGYLTETADNDNYLSVGEKDEYAKCSIKFNQFAAQIIFKQKPNGGNIIVNNGKWRTSCAYSIQSNQAVYLYKFLGTAVPNRLSTPIVEETINNKEITLQWDAVEGATSYTILWKDEDGNEEQAFITTECIYSKENLTNGMLYYYQVRANSTNNQKVNSTWTSEKVVIPTSGTYQLITSNEGLVAGATYLIATSGNAGTAYTMGAQNGNYRDRTEVEIINVDGIKTITYQANNYYPIRLEASNSNWKFKDLKNNGYLVGGSRIFKIDSNGSNQEFTATINNGVASVKYGAYYLKYNSGSPRFTCYSSGQSDIYLYKETGEQVLPTPIVTAIGLNREVTLEWTQALNATYYLTWNGTESATPITSPHTVSGLTNGTEYTYQIKAVRDEEEKISAEGTIIPVPTKTYELVTSNSDLTSGTSYLIVNSKTPGVAYAMDKTGGNNIISQQVTILSNNTIEYLRENCDYILQKDTENNAWEICEEVTGSNIYTPYDSNTLKISSEEEYLTAEDPTIIPYLFNINIGEDGNILISGFSTALQTRSIKFNPSNQAFSFYTLTSQGMKDIYLFKCID